MNQIDIRRIAPRETELLRELNAVLGAAFEEVEAYTRQPPSNSYLEGWLENSDNFALVAIDHGAVIGGAVAYNLPRPERARSEMMIYDIAVLSSHRRRGVATAILDCLGTLAPAAGADVMFIEAVAGDEPPTALYRSIAEREQQVVQFDLPLSRLT